MQDDRTRRDQAALVDHALTVEPNATFDIYCDPSELDNARSVFLEVLGPRRFERLKFLTIRD